MQLLAERYYNYQALQMTIIQNKDRITYIITIHYYKSWLGINDLRRLLLALKECSKGKSLESYNGETTRPLITTQL